jgi:hypothetical protein
MTTTVGLELERLRALAKSGRAAALKAMRQRREEGPAPAANQPRPSQNGWAVTKSDTDAQAQAVQMLDLRS